MVALVPGDTGYDTILFLHILCVIIGFGSTFVWPLLAAKAQGLPPAQTYAINHTGQGVAHILTTPFIIAAGVLGLALVGMSTDVWKFDQTWVWLSIVLYAVALCISFGLHLPNLKRMDELGAELAAMGPPPEGAPGGGPPPQVVEIQARAKKAGMFGGMLHLLFFLILFNMVFKPGI